jgi:hypothetical protein
LLWKEKEGKKERREVWKGRRKEGINKGRYR